MCLELIQDDEAKLELAQLDRFKKEATAGKLNKHATIKMKMEADKEVKEAVADLDELAAEL